MMRLEGVMLQDGATANVYTLHGECADRVMDKVNGECGYARMFVYGPSVLETCAAIDCPHKD